MDSTDSGKPSFRTFRWLFSLVAILLLAGTGVSLFGTPDYELLHQNDPPIVTCMGGSCTGIYTTIIGNSGVKDQEQVVARFHEIPLTKMLLPMNVSNFGKTIRSIDVKVADSVATVHLGTIKNTQDVHIRLVFQEKNQSQLPSWEDLLIGVESTSTTSKPGAANLTKFGRMWMRILDWF